MQAQASYANELLPEEAPLGPPPAFPSPSAESLSRRPLKSPEPEAAQEILADEPFPELPSFTATILAEQKNPSLGFELRRFGVGLGLASLYGLALGARSGGLSLFRHAAGVPLAMVAVGCLGVPALTIVLTLFNAPISPSRALSAASRSAAATGLVFGGLAPAAALFVVTSESRITAAFMALLGLFIGGVFGIRVLLRDLKHAMEGETDLINKTLSTIALGCFALFAVAMALRVWWSSLPLLKGGL